MNIKKFERIMYDYIVARPFATIGQNIQFYRGYVLGLRRSNIMSQREFDHLMGALEIGYDCWTKLVDSRCHNVN